MDIGRTVSAVRRAHNAYIYLLYVCIDEPAAANLCPLRGVHPARAVGRAAVMRPALRLGTEAPIAMSLTLSAHDPMKLDPCMRRLGYAYHPHALWICSQNRKEDVISGWRTQCSVFEEDFPAPCRKLSSLSPGLSYCACQTGIRCHTYRTGTGPPQRTQHSYIYLFQFCRPSMKQKP
jgi:hypothetical protein